MTCPYCNAEAETQVSSPSEKCITYSFACTTKLKRCKGYDSVEWDCRDGRRPEANPEMKDKYAV